MAELKLEREEELASAFLEYLRGLESRVVRALSAGLRKHLPGEHDQDTHGREGSGEDKEGSKPKVDRKLKTRNRVGRGMFGAEYLEYEDGTKAVYKPVVDANNSRSEVASYELSERLGLGVVPETTYDKALKGTVQQFANGTIGEEVADLGPAYSSDSGKKVAAGKVSKLMEQLAEKFSSTALPVGDLVVDVGEENLVQEVMIARMTARRNAIAFSKELGVELPKDIHERPTQKSNKKFIRAKQKAVKSQKRILRKRGRR